MSKQTQSFNAEIKQLLDIVIHSLYSHKEIFLRELISNASDAIDKLKFNALTQSDLLPANWTPQIRLEIDADKKILRIIDNGIGMSEAEVKEFIGTIARSGAKAFSSMTKEMKERPELIGQFGVGFYSAFMVADQVQLLTQKAGATNATLWESSGDGTYSIEPSVRELGTGTTISLHLKTPAAATATDQNSNQDSEQNFTDTWLIKSLVKKYSDFIAHPIVMKIEDKDETLNSQKALWLKPASEITEQEHKDFYQHLSHDFNEPLKTIHYRAEGSMEFNALLYIPSKKPWNYFSRDTEFGLSLYVKRVFIMADCKELIPTYLRFVKGLVDSQNLSLNVSRELLQQDRQVGLIRKNLTGKVLSALKDDLQKDRPKYEKFWGEFGATLKEGLPADPAQKDRLQELLLFHSTASSGLTSLEEYSSRMPSKQTSIYYITGDDLKSLSQSPYLEKLREKNLEVLLLVDPVDEWVVSSVTEYQGKKLTSVALEGLDLSAWEGEESSDQKAEKKKQGEELAPVLELLKKHLDAQVSDVVVSDRLSSTPVCLVSKKDELSIHMQKILQQMGQKSSMENKRILEINPQHPVFQKFKALNSDRQLQWAELLYSQALLNEGSSLPDPVKFSKQVADLMVNSPLS